MALNYTDSLTTLKSLDKETFQSALALGQDKQARIVDMVGVFKPVDTTKVDPVIECRADIANKLITVRTAQSVCWSPATTSRGTGTQGTQGIQGIQGIQGVQGMDGLQGIQGIQGTMNTNDPYYSNNTLTSEGLMNFINAYLKAAFASVTVKDSALTTTKLESSDRIIGVLIKE